MKKFRRGLLVLSALLVVGFIVLWIVGPEPVAMGPYVTHVTTDGADICCFDEKPSRVVVRLSLPDGGERTVREREPTVAHRLRVSDLRPDTRYEYRIVAADSGDERWSGSFKTAPANDSGLPFTFAVVGDSGDLPRWFKLHRCGWGRMRGLLAHTERTGQWDVAQWIVASQPDLFVHLGDIIYSRNELPAYEEAFFRPFADVLRRCPVVAAPGNHDMHDWEHPEFFRIFSPPRPLDPKQRFADFSHSFVWGSVRFFVLDWMWQKWEDGGVMARWLDQSLADSRRERKIVVMHHPFFSDEADVTEHVELRKALWPIFVRHRVDLVVAGDSHSYQRFKPIDGVTLVIAGTGGKSIRPVAATDRLAHFEERFGFLLVKVTGRRIEGEFRTGAAAPLDRFLVVE